MGESIIVVSVLLFGLSISVLVTEKIINFIINSIHKKG